MAKKKEKVSKRATAKKTTTPDDGRLLLLGEYLDVADLVNRGTSDDRITAAVFCNYPVGNLNVEHLTNDDLKTIVATFTPNEWITYGFNGAVHETAFAFIQEFQRAASEYLANGRILHSYVLAHKTARQTGEMLTELVKGKASKKKIKDGAPSLYGWNITPDGMVTPDFTQKIGDGITFKTMIENASKDVCVSMEKAKTLYQAFVNFREKIDDEITLNRKDDIFFDNLVKYNTDVIMRNYAPFPEYGTAHIKEYADQLGVNMNDLPAEILDLDLFPSWGMVTPDPLRVSERETMLYKTLSENARDYARIVSDATGLSTFKIGTYTYMRAGNVIPGEESGNND